MYLAEQFKRNTYCMNKDKVQLIGSKAMLEYIDTVNYDAQFTRGREVYNGRNLTAKQIKAEI